MIAEIVELPAFPAALLPGLDQVREPQQRGGDSGGEPADRPPAGGDMRIGARPPVGCHDVAHHRLLKEREGKGHERVEAGHGRASRIRLKGVSAARRMRVKPAEVTTSRSRVSPAWAPRPSPTSWLSEFGVQII